MKTLTANFVLCMMFGSMAIAKPSIQAHLPLSQPSHVAAIVNGTPITSAQLAADAPPMPGQGTLLQLIDYRLLDQAAQKEHIRILSSSLAAGEKAALPPGSPQSVAATLKAHQMTLKMVDEQVLHSMILKKLADQQMPPAPLLCHARWIVLGAGAKVTLSQLQKMIADGRAFSDLAKLYSTDAVTSKEGGDMGLLSKYSNMPYQVIAAALALKPGQITAKPVSTPKGECLIQCVSDSAHPGSSDQKLYQAANANYRQFWLPRMMMAKMSALRGAAHVVIYPSSTPNL